MTDHTHQLYAMQKRISDLESSLIVLLDAVLKVFDSSLKDSTEPDAIEFVKSVNEAHKVLLGY